MIHTLNFNNYIKKHKLAKICINSWKKEFPDEEICIWDEKTINKDWINTPFFKYYSSRNLIGPACDSLKCHLLYEYGGTFLDPDIELNNGISNIIYSLNKNEEFNTNVSISSGIRSTHCLSDINRYIKKSNIMKNLCNAYDNPENLLCDDWVIAYLKNTIKTNDDVKNHLRIAKNSTLLLNLGIRKYYTHWNLHGYFFENNSLVYFGNKINKIFIINDEDSFNKTKDYITKNKSNNFNVYYSTIPCLSLHAIDVNEICFDRFRTIHNLDSFRLYLTDILKRRPKILEYIIDWNDILTEKFIGF